MPGAQSGAGQIGAYLAVGSVVKATLLSCRAGSLNRPADLDALRYHACQ
jgi:hypothetical protein